MPDPLLAVSGLRGGYGKTEILRGIDLAVEQVKGQFDKNLELEVELVGEW